MLTGVLFSRLRHLENGVVSVFFNLDPGIEIAQIFVRVSEVPVGDGLRFSGYQQLPGERVALRDGLYRVFSGHHFDVGLLRPVTALCHLARFRRLG